MFSTSVKMQALFFNEEEMGEIRTALQEQLDNTSDPHRSELISKLIAGIQEQ